MAKPGRPKKISLDTTVTTDSNQVSVGLGGNANQSPASPKGPKKPPRIPLNAGMNLHIPENILEKDKYAYRWFAESQVTGGRIEIAKNAYWEHVVDTNGQNYKRPSRTDTMYLMKLELKYWHEDQEAKRNKVKMTTLRESVINTEKGEYAPNGGEMAVTKTL